MSMKLEVRNKKNIVRNVILNMFASATPLVLLQFSILPRLAERAGDAQYGKIVTITSIFLLISGAFGSAFNNSRLLSNEIYENESVKGDYNLLIIFSVFVNATLVLCFSYILSRPISIFELIGLGTIASINLFINYGIVEFRLNLNYCKILLNSILLSLGYVVGYLIFSKGYSWLYIYLFGYLFSGVYILKSTGLVFEGINRTGLYKRTSKQVIYLIGSSILVSSGTYLDKIILFPLLGGSEVAVYYTATIIPKMISLFIEPITGVALTYLIKLKEIKKALLFKALTLLLFAGLIGYFLVVLLSPFILTYLYPQYTERAMQFMPVTCVSAILAVCTNLINTIILRFQSARWQLILNLSYIASYLVFAIIGFLLFNLMGFCIGLLVAITIKLIACIIILYSNEINVYH